MSTTRRDFMAAGGGLAAAMAVIGTPLATRTAVAAEHGAAGALTEHTLPDLPYAYDALEPYIDAKTMELHHSRHHQAYVSGLNATEKALAEARAKGDFGTIEHLSKKATFHGGGHFLHSMFWKVMAPAENGGGGDPAGALASHIERDFGSFSAFKAQFTAASNAVEGGGWGLLHYRPGDDRLIVLQAENQHKLSAWDSVPVLGVDVWEHAYYLKYQNARGEYVNQWWNVVNWSQVAANVTALQEAFA